MAPRYLSVISVSGCETMVMNQTALSNSAQNVSQQSQNIAAAHATSLCLGRLLRSFRTDDGLNTMARRGEVRTSVPVFGL